MANASGWGRRGSIRVQDRFQETRGVRSFTVEEFMTQATRRGPCGRNALAQRH